MNLPLRWDAGWYLDIAVHGYRWSPAAEGQQNVAFFPAYPALMSLGAALVNAGNEPEGLGVRLSYERYYVWHLVNLALAIGSGGLLSVGRVVSTLFPLFIYLGARLTPGQSALAAAVFATLQGFGAALFHTWRPFL